MAKAARAIIIQNNKILVMHRDKHGSQYYTLVGGRVNDGEQLEETVRREVKEETNLDVTSARLVFIEQHPAPYNEQYIFLCEVAPHDTIGLRSDSEEALMNRIGINMHKPEWMDIRHFPKLAFNTMQLQKAIVDGFQNGFSDEPQQI